MPNFVELDQAVFKRFLSAHWPRLGYGLNTFLLFMSSYKGLGPKKQFWPIRMKLSKPFHRQLFHYAENLLYELLSNIHGINCPTLVCRTKIRPLTCYVISLAQYSRGYACAMIVHTRADQLLPQLLMDQFDTLP